MSGRFSSSAPELGVGFDAAIGDDHGAAVGEQLNVMRLHAARREFADLPVAVGRVADADDALRVCVIVLGGVEQLAVGGEDAMAEEMPVGLGAEPGRRPAIGGHGDTKTSRPAGKGDPFVRARAQRDVVTALGQLNRADIAALEREQSRGVAAAIVAARGGEQLHVVSRPWRDPKARPRAKALLPKPMRSSRRSRSMINLHPWR